MRFTTLEVDEVWPSTPVCLVDFGDHTWSMPIMENVCTVDQLVKRVFDMFMVLPKAVWEFFSFGVQSNKRELLLV